MAQPRSPFPIVLLAAVLLAWAADFARAEDDDTAELKTLSLEALLETEFTSLSKKPEKRREVPAAVTTITSEAIHRSGVRSIPEALRLAPGVQVARVDSNQWAVGIRGFASPLARSQLALMDGRSLYTPLFAGVYWDVQDTFLEDIERIEVIRGPGGVLWGANAVNGVVNILTKSAKDTQGLVLSSGGGTEERAFGGFRYGGLLGENVWFRVYGKYFDRDGMRSPGVEDYDDWHMGRVGFRSDVDLPGGDLLTVQGDLYGGESGKKSDINSLEAPFVETVTRDADLSGGNLLARWTRSLGEGSEVVLQTYYDQTFRRDPTFREQRDTFDLDLQHHFPLGEMHDFVWGLGYRFSADRTGTASTVRFDPADEETNLFSAFLQDEIEILPDHLRLTLGTKVEHNDFSGFEFQPSGRLTWLPLEDHVLWASFTRAVRTPSRIEHDLEADVVIEPETPTFARLTGDSSFDPEKVYAYESGWRWAVRKGLFLDVAAFFNRYEDYLSIESGAPSPSDGRLVIPFAIRNGLRGDVYGVEVGADAQPLDGWWLRGSYSYLEIDFRRRPGSTDASTIATTEGSSPQHQVSLQSAFDLPGGFEADLWLRYVDRLPAQRVDSYVTFDARLGWQVTDQLEIAAVGQNLAESTHLEWGADDGGLEVERGGYGEVTWRW